MKILCHFYVIGWFNFNITVRYKRNNEKTWFLTSKFKVMLILVCLIKEYILPEKEAFLKSLLKFTKHYT